MPGVIVAAIVLLLAAPTAPPQQVTGQDLDKILERADGLLDEAKKLYEGARVSGSAAAFVDAGFKLEEARIKYIVLQEIGSAEKQKTAADQLRTVQQLNKLINDGKKAAAPSVAPDAPPPTVKAPDSRRHRRSNRRNPRSTSRGGSACPRRPGRRKPKS